MIRKSRKILSPDGLWQQIHSFFSSKDGKDKLCGEKKSSASNVVDCLMACCAVFALKLPSLLQYDKKRNKELHINLKNLFHINTPPSDTTMRERLDNVNPANIRGVFKHLFSHIQRGKGLEHYEFYEGHYLISNDATAHFSSSKISCENCCTKHHKTGKVTHHHNMLCAVVIHPDIKRVIPLAPEPITKQDGISKNDCEQNAASRLLSDFRREHPHLKAVITEDSLYSTGPHIALLKKLDLRFIISAKPGNLKLLFEFINGIEMKEYSYVDSKGTKHEFKYINTVPLNDSNFEIKVNFVEYWETSKKGKKQHFSWITDLPLTEDTVALVMRGGRARWRIENETFNTLKNQGYNLEHNFGHGKAHLCSVMGMLMLLAFFVDQVSELFNELFQKVRVKERTYYELWEKQRALFQLFLFKSWDQLYGVIASDIPLTLVDSS